MTPEQLAKQDAELCERQRARMDADEREAFEDDAPDEYEVMQRDDRNYSNHS